jgi:hypothetical protein
LKFIVYFKRFNKLKLIDFYVEIEYFEGV